MNRSTEQINEEPREYSRYRMLEGRSDLLVLAFILALIITLFIVGLLIAIAAYFPILIMLFAIGIGMLPAIGICFLIVMLIRYAKKPQIVDVNQVGTVFRLPSGNMQIISPQELYAFETFDAVPILPEKPKSIVDVGSGYYSNLSTDIKAFPETFPIEDYSGNVSSTEINLETSAETVVQKLHMEEQKAKQMLQGNERDVLKARILELHGIGLSLGSIAKQVHMSGRNYTKFKELCEEVGIHTD